MKFNLRKSPIFYSTFHSAILQFLSLVMEKTLRRKRQELKVNIGKFLPVCEAIPNEIQLKVDFS
jgi:hypothetical protein